MPINSQNKLICSQSAWALDANSLFLTQRTAQPACYADCGSGSTDFQYGRGPDFGELQNNYTTVHSNWMDFYRTGFGPRSAIINDTVTTASICFWTTPGNMADNFGSGSWESSGFSTLGSPGHGPIYNRRHTMNSIFSFVNPSGPIIPQVKDDFVSLATSYYLGPSQFIWPWNPYVSPVFPAATNWPPTGAFPMGAPQIYAGEALWEANRLANCQGEFNIVISSSTQGEQNFIKSPISPFYNTYSSYGEDLATQNRDYSILPEFKISQWLPYYLEEQGGNFLAPNPAEFDITGIKGSTKEWVSGQQNNAMEINSNEIKNSSQDHFYKIFSNSDFMKHYKQLRTDHEDFVDPTTITLTCEAILKLLPYDGFYPAERTLQIAHLMSQSFGENIGVVLNGVADIADNPWLSSSAVGVPGLNMIRRPFYSTMFSPGLLYNSIKAGMAVDYPVYTSSFDMVQYTNRFQHPTEPGPPQSQDTFMYAIGTGSNGYDGFDYRIPFEALVDPGSYLKDLVIMDMEPHPEATYNQGLMKNPCLPWASGLAVPDSQNYFLDESNTWGTLANQWDGQVDSRLYKYAINNFLAETPEFFLRDEKFSSISSAHEDDFKEVVEGRFYSMRAKISRTLEAPRSWTTWGLGQSNLPVLKAPVPQDPIAFNGAKRQEYFGMFPTIFPVVGNTNTDSQVIPRENFTLYSRNSAFGPPCAGTGSTAGGKFLPSSPGPQSLLNITAYGMSPSDATTGFYCPFTPAYKDGEGWADFIFQAPSSGKPTLDEIQANMMVFYWRIDPLLEAEPIASAGFPTDVLTV